MPKILKDPVDYAADIRSSYLTPTLYTYITVELARLRPALPVEYIEDVIRELKKLNER